MTEETRKKLAALFAEMRRLQEEAFAKLSQPHLTGEAMSKHTSGPWEVVDGNEPGPGFRTRVARPGGLALIQACNQHDAHLIAAAPDLLAALEAWQSLRFECVEDGSPAPRDGCECSVCDTSRESAAAIARAEGKR